MKLSTCGAGVLLAVMLSFSTVSCKPGCTTYLTGERTSPGGKYVASLSSEKCKATSTPETSLRVEKSGQRLQLRRPTVLALYGKPGVRVQWTGPSKLRVEYPAKAAVRTKVARWGPVRIEYSTYVSCVSVSGMMHPVAILTTTAKLDRLSREAAQIVADGAGWDPASLHYLFVRRDSHWKTLASVRRAGGGQPSPVVWSLSVMKGLPLIHVSPKKIPQWSNDEWIVPLEVGIGRKRLKAVMRLKSLSYLWGPVSDVSFFPSSPAGLPTQQATADALLNYCCSTNPQWKSLFALRSELRK